LGHFSMAPLIQKVPNLGILVYSIAKVSI